MGGNVEGLVGGGVFEVCVGALIVFGAVECQAHGPGLRGGGLVGDLDGELEGVALAQEARGIGLHHQILGGDGVGFEEAAAQGRVVGEAEEMPLGEGFGHGECQAHDAVGAGHELGKEEGGFVQVFARGDLGEVGLGRGVGASRWRWAEGGRRKRPAPRREPRFRPGRFRPCEKAIRLWIWQNWRSACAR